MLHARVFQGYAHKLEKDLDAWLEAVAHSPQFRIVSVTQSANRANPGYNSEIQLTVIYETG